VIKSWDSFCAEDKREARRKKHNRKSALRQEEWGKSLPFIMIDLLVWAIN
jgi:hypothetical protein